jgi:hypothetical protein
VFPTKTERANLKCLQSIRDKAYQRKSKAYLHFVRRFWNHVFTWASVIFNPLANAALSAEAKYFCLWNLFSSSATCILVNDVLGFFRFGGVLF